MSNTWRSPANRVVVAGRRSRFAEAARPFSAIRARDPPHFTRFQAVPAIQKRQKNLIPIMSRARFGRHVIGLVLLMNFERFAKRNFSRSVTCTRDQAFPMLS